jgi:predicted nucleic acid-binding protein
MNYLLDTNHASPLVTFDDPLRHRILSAIQSGDIFAVSTVNLAEILFGILTLPRARQNQIEWDHLRPSLRMYKVEERDIIVAVEIRIKLRKSGRQIGLVDTILAALAIRYDLILLTTDKDFDAIPALKLANWLSHA